MHAIQVFKHEKLNQPSNPCDPSPDYDFAECVERHVVKEVGCQLPWNRETVEDMPLCDNSTAFMEYDILMTQVTMMPMSVLVETTQCLLPCVFTEFKVSLKVIINFCMNFCADDRKRYYI